VCLSVAFYAAHVDGQAPAGGVTVLLASSNESAATVSPSSLSLNQGELTATFTISGISSGATTISASATGFPSIQE
jgi:hypothetical protein